MIQVKNTKQLINENTSFFGQIKTYYGCYETTKNGSLHIHTLLWLNNSPYPNTLIQTLCDDESFRENMINYLNIITCDVDKYELSNPITQNNNNKYDDHIRPCTTRPPNTNEKYFHEFFDKDVCKLMNVCNHHICNH
jgi:hypothetical protein